MPKHVVFVAPFFMETTLRFVKGAAGLDGVALSLISQDPASRLPADLKRRLAGHWRVENALDAGHIVEAARGLAQQLGPVQHLIGALEQLQVPMAQAREALRVPGLSVEAALNFRDKSRMKDVLRSAGIPCAKHMLAGSTKGAQTFADEVGYPVVVKPPAGAGGKGTYRVDNRRDLETLLGRHPPSAADPILLEEFVTGTEHSFDSVFVRGKPAWYSISRYMPSPLQVLENPWIQWCVLLPRDVETPEFAGIADTALSAVRALGMQTGLSHMEWFRRPDGRIAISEVGARPPGAQITSLLSYAHDLDFYKAWPRLLVYDDWPCPERRYAVGAAYVRGQGRGRIKSIYGLDEAQKRFGSIVVEAQLPRAGQFPSDSYEGDGFVILRHPETAVVENALKEIVQLIRVELG